MAMIDDADLIERTRIALESVGDCPWLPGLTGDLVKKGWQILDEEIGMTPSNYATSRVMAKSIQAPCNVASYLSNSWAIEILNENLADNYKDAEIEFYTAKEIKDVNLSSCLEDVLNLIKQVPTLYATVAALVRSAHLIKPEDDDYDLSFSEPHIPFSIFISVPRRHSSTTALRIAEAVVHEAMHLQLTLVEQVLPLANLTRGKSYSPWRREYRPVQGILHALYVFRIISIFLRKLSDACSVEMVQYMEQRQDEITDQIREIQPFQCSSGLTPIGTSFVQKLL